MSAEKRIKELEKEQIYQTESEQADTLTMISSLQSEASAARTLALEHRQYCSP